MAIWPNLLSGFKLLKEVDLNAVREKAEADVYIMVMGREGSGRTELINQLVSGPRAGQTAAVPPVSKHGLNAEIVTRPNTVVLCLIDATIENREAEYDLVERLHRSGARVIVCYNGMDAGGKQGAGLKDMGLLPDVEKVIIDAANRESVLGSLVPVVLRVCKGMEIPLARRFALFREVVCRKLIDEACMMNSVYSFTTGLAEMNIILNVPLNVADVIVLTKNQALMSYKISLAMGMAADWKETAPKLAAVVGNAFLWRQAARSLVGLIPA